MECVTSCMPPCKHWPWALDGSAKFLPSALQKLQRLPLHSWMEHSLGAPRHISRMISTRAVNAGLPDNDQTGPRPHLQSVRHSLTHSLTAIRMGRVKHLLVVKSLYRKTHFAHPALLLYERMQQRSGLMHKKN